MDTEVTGMSTGGSNANGGGNGSEASQTSAQQGAATQQTSGTGVSASQANGAGNDGGAQAQAGAAQTEQSVAYTPNFKFKVKDKELEFDDLFKPIIKSKEHEAKIREMHEKVFGLDEVKTARDNFKTEVEEWKGKHGTLENSIKTLGEYVKKDDFRTFFKLLNIPKEKIINYAIQELKYQEMSPEQRAVVDQQYEQQLASERATTENQQLHTQMAQMIQRQTAFELDQELAKPDVASRLTAYDAQIGKPGAFKTEVIRRGQYYEAVHKISPPASQLVSEILALIGPAQTQQGTPAVPQNQSSPTGSQTQQAKPVIPAFSGGGKSPTKKVPNSIDDLRKMRAEL